ncbi:MAG: GNAT family N-acetyltransferase [Thermoflexibacter sp.]|jgi:ribosomal protein S18 acetylase RimI-like enzyme|nr:GNAT family N-acetyltransferase [Thermoflexibacter sp.]
MNIRNIGKQDLPVLKRIIDSVELFPSDLLDEMTSSYFENHDTEEIWLTKTAEESLMAIVYCAPEKLTNGTYNLYLIAVHQDYQGQGIGNEMITYLENLLKRRGARILLVETSGLPHYELTRQFYDKTNYQRHAVIKDFYQDGEDKIVFWKKL